MPKKTELKKKKKHYYINIKRCIPCHLLKQLFAPDSQRLISVASIYIYIFTANLHLKHLIHMVKRLLHSMPFPIGYLGKSGIAYIPKCSCFLQTFNIYVTLPVHVRTVPCVLSLVCRTVHILCKQFL